MAGGILKDKKFLFLIAAAFLVHFWSLSYPAEVVFDEVHFGKFVSSYFDGQYYFDIHPPLGKLMIAGFVKKFGASNVFDFSQIGRRIDKHSIYLFRFLPAFFGFLFVLLVYKTILAFGMSGKSAFLGAFLALFDNAILAQSKFILMDIFLLFFGFLSVYFFLIYKKEEKKISKKNILLAFAAMSASLAFSIKWTGLSFVGLLVLFVFIDSLKKFKIKDLAVKMIIILTVFSAVYTSVFYFHFKNLTQPGPGSAFMSKEFNEGKLSFWGKFKELNVAMYKYNAGLTATHPDGSKWSEWIVGKKPVWFWTKNIDGRVANIYLLPNPAVWWTAGLSVIFLALLLLMRKADWRGYFIFAGYAANLLPFIFVTRVAFLYHYLAALVFAILALVYLHNKILEIPTAKKTEKILFPIFLIIVFGFFINFAPSTYGF